MAHRADRVVEGRVGGHGRRPIAPSSRSCGGCTVGHRNFRSDDARGAADLGHLRQEHRVDRLDQLRIESTVPADRDREIPRVDQLIHRGTRRRLRDRPLETRRRHATTVERTRHPECLDTPSNGRAIGTFLRTTRLRIETQRAEEIAGAAGHVRDQRVHIPFGARRRRRPLVRTHLLHHRRGVQSPPVRTTRPDPSARRPFSLQTILS